MTRKRERGAFLLAAAFLLLAWSARADDQNDGLERDHWNAVLMHAAENGLTDLACLRNEYVGYDRQGTIDAIKTAGDKKNWDVVKVILLSFDAAEWDEIHGEIDEYLKRAPRDVKKLRAALNEMPPDENIVRQYPSLQDSEQKKQQLVEKARQLCQAAEHKPYYWNAELKGAAGASMKGEIVLAADRSAAGIPVRIPIQEPSDHTKALLKARWDLVRNDVDEALQKGADVNDGSPDGVTALIWAVSRHDMGSGEESGKWELIRLLVEKGANVTLKDKGGQTALDLVLERNSEGVPGDVLCLLNPETAEPRTQTCARSSHSLVSRRELEAQRDAFKHADKRGPGESGEMAASEARKLRNAGGTGDSAGPANGAAANAQTSGNKKDARVVAKEAEEKAEEAARRAEPAPLPPPPPPK